MLAAGQGARRALAAVLSSVVVASGLLMDAPAAQALTSSSDVVESQPAVAPVDPLLGDDEDLEVSVSAGSTTTPSDRVVQVLLTTTPVTTRYTLSRWLEGDDAPPQTVIATGILPAGHEQTTLTVDADALQLPTAGAYLLSATIEGVDQQPRSFVIADQLGDAGPTSLALAGDTTVPVPSTGLLDAEALEAATAPDSDLERQLSLAEEHDVALGVDPVIAASVAALGDDAPTSAVEWLERASALDEAYPTEYAGADVVTLARAEVSMPEPIALPSPDGTLVSPEAAAEPPAGTPIVDATSASLDAELLGSIAESGTPIVSTTSLDEWIDQVTPSAHASVGGVDVLAADGELQPLVDAAAASTGVAAADARARVVALLATITLEAPSVQRVLAASIPLGEHAPELLEVLADADWIDSASIADALDEPARDAALEPADASGAEASAVDRVHEALSIDASTAGVLAAIDADDVDVVRAPQRLTLLATIADASRVDGEGSLSALSESSADIANGVTLADGGTTLIVSGNAELPITVTNSLPVPVTVQVVASPGNPIVSVDREPVEIEIPAETQQRVSLHVDAVGTGASELRVQILAPDGQQILAPVTLAVDAQPAVELILLIVVVAASALLVGFGIWRSIRKRRRGASHGDLDVAATYDHAEETA